MKKLKSNQTLISRIYQLYFLSIQQSTNQRRRWQNYIINIANILTDDDEIYVNSGTELKGWNKIRFVRNGFRETGYIVPTKDGGAFGIWELTDKAKKMVREMESSNMIPVLSIFILTSLDPIKNFVSLKTYISENAKVHCQVYFIDENISDYPRVNVIEKSRVDFFAYLDTINVEHTQVGGYFFFRKKPNSD